MLAVPDQVFLDGFWVERIFTKQLMNTGDVDEIRFATTSQFGNKILNVYAGHQIGSLH
jgi:hypothetical protein